MNQVDVLEANDPSTADKDPPNFLEELPSESIVMEGHSYELQVRLSGEFVDYPCNPMSFGQDIKVIDDKTLQELHPSSSRG